LELAVQPDIRETNRVVIDQYRHQGVYSSGEMPLVLVTTVGRVTGAPHTAPMAVSEDGERLVVVGSRGGLPEHPQWYDNLVAEPRVTVEYRGEVFPAVARTVHVADERRRLMRLMETVIPGLPRYQDRAAAHRQIPVVLLERQDLR
jgi:F420H(2)-dependent quinone reductase